jgi:hypothetical protein
MPNKTLPTTGSTNWGETLNNFLTQSLDNTNGGGINKFDTFSLRPTTLGADDKGKTYLYTQTGNFHQWTGTEWKVLNESVINVKDYGAVGGGVTGTNSNNYTGTDDALAINTAANIARNKNLSLFIPSGNFLIGSSLSFDNLRVFGIGITSRITANNSQFNLITAQSNFYCQNLSLNGGWDGSTTGQTGDVIHVDPGVSEDGTTLNFGGNIFIENVKISWAKANGIYLTSLGYSSIKSTDVRACGSNGLYMYGKTGAEAITTVDVNNSCVFNDCPNGYGIVIHNGIRINISTATIEFGKGIKIDGNDNRSISIENCYQENTYGPDQLDKYKDAKFVTLAGAGIGLNISNCFCSNTGIDYTPSFLGVTLFNNFLLNLPAQAYNWTAQHNPQNQIYTINKLSTVLGANLNNESGASPAHIFNTSQLSGLDKSIVEFQNGGITKFRINAEGGIAMTGGYDGGCIKMGDYHLWVDSAGKLRMKSGQPTSDTDGGLVGAQG